jgi:citrate synthase
MPDTLTVTDNRTGKQYTIPVKDGAVRAMDLRQIRVSDDDFGLLCYDPGLENTATCRSSVTFIDGDRSILRHRGYPIEELAEKSSYLEVAYLLVFGELPTKKQLEDWTGTLKQHSLVHENIRRMISGFSLDAHPMGMLLTVAGSLSTFYPDSKDIFNRERALLQAYRAIAKMPTLAGLCYQHRGGLPTIYPDPQYSYGGNFLRMLFANGNPNYKPHPTIEHALDILLILQADHEQNCSTNAMRAISSSQPDPYVALVGSIGALYGPLHGGANEAALNMLHRIGSKDKVADFVKRVKNREERLMGFGHRVYKSYDPRARIIRKTLDEVFEVTGRNEFIDVALELERVALADEYFVTRKLYPNVDFYSGIMYEAIGLKADMFTVIFAIARTAGWMAQWLEMLQDKEAGLVRPRQIYTGQPLRSYVPIAQRR